VFSQLFASENAHGLLMKTVVKDDGQQQPQGGNQQKQSQGIQRFFINANRNIAKNMKACLESDGCKCLSGGGSALSLFIFLTYFRLQLYFCYFVGLVLFGYLIWWISQQGRSFTVMQQGGCDCNNLGSLFQAC